MKKKETKVNKFYALKRAHHSFIKSYGVKVGIHLVRNVVGFEGFRFLATIVILRSAQVLSSSVYR